MPKLKNIGKSTLFFPKTRKTLPAGAIFNMEELDDDCQTFLKMGLLSKVKDGDVAKKKVEPSGSKEQKSSDSTGKAPSSSKSSSGKSSSSKSSGSKNSGSKSSNSKSSNKSSDQSSNKKDDADAKSTSKKSSK